MPKLNHIHLIERLKNRIDQLENGEGVEARDINELNPIQQNQLKDAWAEQQSIRKSHKTKAAAEKAGLGNRFEMFSWIPSKLMTFS